MGVDCLERDGYLFVANWGRLDSRQILSMARLLGFVRRQIGNLWL
jgi:hypothetical protein